MNVYYNEFDKNAAAWLRELIRDEAIADGFVDERDVADVRADDLGDARKCHFFAGIGGWDYALQLAAWPAGRSVWTASLPCQPFSDAGKRLGTADKRHLWPVFRDLVEECRPAVIFGEQVASKAGRAWFSIVRDDLEKLGYACGAADLCAAGIGAPHIRQRLFWVAVSGRGKHGRRLQRSAESVTQSEGGTPDEFERSGGIGGMGHTKQFSTGRDAGSGPGAETGPVVRAERDRARSSSAVGGLPDTNGRQSRSIRTVQSSGEHRLQPQNRGDDGERHQGPWTDVIYVPCADGKARPLEPCLEPLVDGLPLGLVRGGNQRLAPERSAEGRTMRLRGYGNAIVPQLAAIFIETVMEYLCSKKN